LGYRSAVNIPSSGRRTCARASGPFLAAQPAALVSAVRRISFFFSDAIPSPLSYPELDTGLVRNPGVPSYRLTTFPAPNIVSAIVYILDTSPTATFSFKP
jgi:hypothetical protein